MTSRFNGALAALLIAGAVDTVSGQEALTIEDVIRLGLKSNYDIRVARNSSEIAANNAGKGAANFLPTVDATGNYSRSSTRQTTNSPFSFGDSDSKSWGADVSFNWTVFDGFRMFAVRKRYDELAKLGDYQARYIIENTVVQISRAYFNLVQHEQLIEVAKSAHDISRDRLERERVRHDLGGASSTDLLNAEVSFNNDRAALLEQQLRLDIARQDLNILLGRDPGTPMKVSEEFVIEPLELGFEQLLDSAEHRNSALLVARQNKRVADQEVRLGQAAFWPRLALTGSYGYSDRSVSSSSAGFDDDITTEETSASVGLVLSFNIFNGRRDWIDLKNARLEASNRQLELRDARNQLRALVRERIRTFEQRMELSALEQESVRAARQNLQLQVDRFELGAATSLEFRDAQVNLVRVQTALIVARYQARLARLEVEQLIGAIRII